MSDLKPRELWAVGPLIALIIVLGVYPRPVLNIINPAVQSTLIGTHSTDPVPPHPVPPVSPVGAAVTTGSSRHAAWVPGLTQASGAYSPVVTPTAGKSAAGKSVVLKLTQGSSG